MKGYPRNTLCIGLLGLLLVVLTGCIKSRQVITLMPDGSGKVELNYGLSESLIQMAKDNEQDPFKEFMPEHLWNQTEGLAAFTEPTRDKADGFTFIRYTGYFRDINKLRLKGINKGGPCEYVYTRDGDGAKLTIRKGTILTIIDENKPTPENEKAEVRKAMAGLTLTDQFIMPGDVKAEDGVSTEGNIATLTLGLEDILEGTGPIQKLKGKESLVITVAAVVPNAEAEQAFKAELDAAVKAWAKKRSQ